MKTIRRILSLCAFFFFCALVTKAGAISFVQVNSAVPQTPQSTVSVSYTSAQVAGDLNVAVVGWNDSTAVVNSVTDTKGNVYQLAVGPTKRASVASQSIYYAKNITGATANSNVVTVAFSVAAAYPDVRILEYSGLDVINPVDVVKAATGTNATSNSGAVTTTNANNLLFAANLVQTSTRAAGSGFTSRIITSPDGDIAEDRVVTSTGSYSATAPLSSAGPWIMQMVAFKAASTTATSDLAVTKTHTGNFTQGQTGATYTITASNVGSASTNGTVTVTDTLPAGLTATALSGTGWTCTLATLTCTRSNVLAANSSYPAITLMVNVAANTPASVTNTTTVSGGGDNSPGNNSVNDVTIVNTLAPAVTINQAAGQADPTNASPINFTVNFSSPVAGFTSSDVTIGGTAGGTKSVAVTGSGSAYNVAVSGMTNGTVTASVPANAAQDAAGNGNTASTSTDNSVTYAVTAIPGLVAAYAFNEGTGTTVADVSGNGNNGTIAGANWTTAGKYGNALSFDGISSYVDLGNPATLRITGSMTWSAWILATGNPPDDGQIIAKSDGSAGWQFKTSPDTGPHTFGTTISPNGTSHVQRYSNTVRSLNTWYHVAGVYDAAARTLDIYVNGVLDNGVLSGTVPASQFDAAQNVTIGRRSGGFYFQGTIDDVRIYNTALTQAQIQTDMNTSLGGSSSDTIPPQVSVTFPQNNAQVNDIITVTADAGDNVGVAGVQFLVDNVNVGVEDTNQPYGLSWDTRTVANGAHTLTARARDTSGNTTLSAPVAVNVANANFFQNEILATGFNLPTNIEFLPDGRMLVVELQGAIKILPPPYTQPDPTPFLQLTNVGSAGVQQGIYDIALDPDFLNNRFYYVFYTAGSPNHDRLSRFTANATLNGTVAGSELILYEDPQNANAEHHGGAINFGNDGKIYFTTGEHFNAPDAQLLSSPRGKIHRINKDGTIPTDNPFFDGAGPNWDSIWALGLRNPFRAYYDAPTGRLIIGDVGGNDYSVAKEEVDLGLAGANYGWPNYEGPCPAPCTSPVYFWPHNGRDSAITGGFVYHGTQFPTSYQGNYFFADYTQNWIRRLTFDGNGNVSGVFNFEPPDGSVDGPYGDIVYLTEGPDGSLYYVDLGYSDISGTFGVSKIRRIRYLQSNQAPIALASANPTSGPTPLTVLFSSAGSLDPEGQAITYLWTFGDGTTSTTANPAHTYTQPGQYTVRLEVSDGVNSTQSTPLFISAGSKPTASILTPQDGTLFIAGDTITFSGDATDIEDGVLPASAFTWNIDFLHEGHVHPGVPITGVKSGAFTIPTIGHDFSGFTRYRIQLTATDSNGLQDVKSVLVYPTKVNLNFDSFPTGLTLKLDGIDSIAPFIHDTLVNFTHSIEAPNQTQGQNSYTFTSWSDGGAQQHLIIVPVTDQSFTAFYNIAQNPLPPGLVAGWSFNEGIGTTAGDASGNGNSLTLNNGATWTGGQYNGGLSLSGSANAVAANSVSLNLSGSYTLTAWIRPSSLSGYQTVLIKENATGSGGCGYWLQTVGNQISSGFNAGSGCIEHTANANLQFVTWYHIAAVFDDAANTYSIYLNGSLLSSQSESAAPLSNNQNLTIGRTAYGENWNGLVDEVRIYNRALSQAEIQTDMNTPLP